MQLVPRQKLKKHWVWVVVMLMIGMKIGTTWGGRRRRLHSKGAEASNYTLQTKVSKLPCSHSLIKLYKAAKSPQHYFAKGFSILPCEVKGFRDLYIHICTYVRDKNDWSGISVAKYAPLNLFCRLQFLRWCYINFGLIADQLD